MTVAKIIDTETTSASEDAALIEYGELFIQLEEFEITYVDDTAVQTFNPLQPISYGAMAVHGFTNEDVASFPPVTDFRYVAPDYVIGHNVDYDCRVVGDDTAKRICTLALSRAAWPDADSHKLLALIYMLDLKKAKEVHQFAHGVAADIDMTLTLLQYLRDYYCFETFEELYALSEEARVPKIMTFGKFKGLPMEDVDRGWRGWYMKQEDQDPWLLKAFEKYPAKY